MREFFVWLFGILAVGLFVIAMYTSLMAHDLPWSSRWNLLPLILGLGVLSVICLAISVNLRDNA